MNELGWQSILAFFILVVAIFWWQRWKRRARRCDQDFGIWKEALHSVGFETTSAVNAIRANLLDFRQVNPSVVMPEHLDEIHAGIQRIARILEIVKDPVGWHVQKKSRVRAQAES